MEITNLVVVPAYGRDYTRGIDAVDAWDAGVDFENVTVGIRGRYVSCRNESALAENGVNSVEIRYAERRKHAVIKIPEVSPAMREGPRGFLESGGDPDGESED